MYWKCIFEQNLYIVRYVYCPHQMTLPTSRGRWDPILLQYEFLAKEVLACKLKTSIQTHSNKSYVLIIFVLCYRPKYSIIKLKFSMSLITIKEWGPRGPFIEFSILFMQNNPHKKTRNCGRDIAWYRGHDSWGINWRLRLGWGHRHSVVIRFSKTWGIFH